MYQSLVTKQSDLYLIICLTKWWTQNTKLLFVFGKLFNKIHTILVQNSILNVFTYVQRFKYIVHGGHRVRSTRNIGLHTMKTIEYDLDHFNICCAHINWGYIVCTTYYEPYSLLVDNNLQNYIHLRSDL